MRPWLWRPCFPLRCLWSSCPQRSAAVILTFYKADVEIFKVFFSLDVNVNTLRTLGHILTPVVNVTDVQFEPLEQVVVDIPFLLMADIQSSSPWPLLLASSSLQMLTISSNTPQAPSQLQGGTRFSKRLLTFQIFHLNAVKVVVCVQWFCRQASVPRSVSVSDAPHWRAAVVRL